MEGGGGVGGSCKFKATPYGNTVSGQGLSQVKRRAGGFSHYVIIPLFVCFNIKTAHRPV